MPSPYSKDQVLALSPDDSSVKASQKLLSPRKWVSLAADERAVWGECQGSGSKPYQVQVDLGEPAFKCSCPSRKFPCKHGLALLVMYADDESAFSVGAAQPAWVSDWLASRQDRAQKKQERQEQAASKPPDPMAQARRQASRQTAMAAGIEEFQLWLRDLVRQGLAQAKERPDSYWQQAAARLVDAKAPGLVTYVRQLSRAHRQGEAWAAEMLEAAGLAWLASAAFRQFDTLSPEARADLQAVLGWTIDTAAVLADGEAVRGTWRVVGIATVDYGQLRQQRVWLQDAAGRPALLLSYAVQRQAFDVTLVAGTQLEAELVYHPGRSPLRAVVKERLGDVRGLEAIAAVPSFSLALDRFSAAVAVNPWLDRYLLAVDSVTPVRTDAGWALVDRDGRSVQVAARFQGKWDLLAVSGGRPLTVAGEWSGGELLPMLARNADGFCCFAHDETDYLAF